CRSVMPEAGGSVIQSTLAPGIGAPAASRTVTVSSAVAGGGAAPSAPLADGAAGACPVAANGTAAGLASADIGSPVPSPGAGAPTSADGPSPPRRSTNAAASATGSKPRTTAILRRVTTALRGPSYGAFRPAAPA